MSANIMWAVVMIVTLLS